MGAEGLALDGGSSRRSLMSLLAEAAPPGAINLGIGEPTHPTPAALIEEIKALVEDDSAEYGPVAGLPGFREFVANRYRGRWHAGELGSECVLATCGVTHAVFVALAALLEDGGGVIYPDPGYVLYEPAIAQCGGVPVPLTLDRDDAFSLDPERLGALITHRTCAVIVNTPSNPTGRIIPADVLQEIALVCGARGVPIVSDEIYEHLVYDGEHRSIAEFSDDVVVCSGISKLYRLAGWRLGWCVASAAAIERLLPHHQYSVFRAPTLAQKIAQRVLTMDAELDELRAASRRKRDLMLRLLREVDGIRVLHPEATFFAYADVSELGSDWDVALTLLANGVVTVPSTGPGAGFGANGAGYLRLSYVIDEPGIEAGVRTIEQATSRQRTTV